MEVRRLAALALLVAGPAVASGCGTGAIDVDGCRQIEEARCRQLPACGIMPEMPWFTSGTTVDACVRYYDDACLHGLAVADPGPHGRQRMRRRDRGRHEEEGQLRDRDGPADRRRGMRLAGAARVRAVRRVRCSFRREREHRRRHGLRPSAGVGQEHVAEPLGGPREPGRDGTDRNA